MIETTLNISMETLEKINKISNLCKTSRNKVIKNLLKMVMDKEPNSFTFNKCVKYQKKDSKEKWHKFHITLDTDEYEYFIDLRKFFKMSVSAIVSFAVKKYYKKIIKCKNTDKYLFKNYIIIKEIINNVISWKIYWGYPEKVEKIFNNQENIL